MHLINPVTGEQITLPSVITIEQVNPIYDDESGAIVQYEYLWFPTRPSIFALSELREYLHNKAFVFSDTCTGSYIVELIHNPNCQLSFARVGDDKWTWLPPYRDYEDCTYKDGLLYAVTSLGEIHAFDLSDPNVTPKIITGKNMDKGDIDRNIYILYAPWGEVLQVWRTKEDRENNYHPETDRLTLVKNTEKIEVYKSDFLAERLVKIDGLQDHVLFLGHNQTLCLSAEEFPSLKANHAYFTDDDLIWIIGLGLKDNRRDIGVFNLDDNSREELVSPQLWSNWPIPLWITPNLAKLNLALDK